MPLNVLELQQQYREALLKQDAAALGRLVRAYQAAFQGLQDKLMLLTDEIMGGETLATVSSVHRMNRYQSLMAQVIEQLRDLQALTKQEMSTANSLGINLGIEHSRGLIAATMGNANLAVAFNKLNPELVKTLTGFLDPNGALMKRLAELSTAGAERIAENLTNGIISGWGPGKIAQAFTRSWGMSLTDSMRMTRTVQLYSYREATRANYVANGDVVTGWIWCAQLDASTCAECIAMDGTYHTNEETLNDHYNGGCAMLPAVKGFDRIIEEGRGQDWFNKQDEETQRQMLGDAKYEAWKEGKFTLSDLTKISKDDVWGDMRSEKTLKELTGDE